MSDNRIAGPIKASVILPTKNGGALFRDVLAAVLGQKTRFSYEVLVIDSGSTDGTVEFLQGRHDPRLRLQRIAPAEFGHGRTRNLGVRLSQGEYVVFLTQDALPANRNWLAALVALADSDPRIAGVFGRHLAYPQASPFTAAELEAHFAGFAAQPVVCLDDPARYARDIGYRQFLHFFSDNNALIRRSVWEQIPYPDVDFAEDQIWAQRVIEAGWKKAYCHEAAVFHSHDYGPLGRLRRSFDESSALHRLFGYRLCPNGRALLRNWLALVWRDWQLTRRQRLWRTHPGSMLAMPLDHLMRLIGHALGPLGERMPPWLRDFLSADRRLLLGQDLPRKA